MTTCSFRTTKKTPYSPEQILSAAMTGIMGTGLYIEAIRVFNKKPMADQMWTNLKKYFADEYHELK